MTDIVNIGSAEDDPSADKIRDAFGKVNTELERLALVSVTPAPVGVPTAHRHDGNDIDVTIGGHTDTLTAGLTAMSQQLAISLETINTKVEKTVASEESLAADGAGTEDFDTFDEAMIWLTNADFADEGEVMLKLKEGIHVTGPLIPAGDAEFENSIYGLSQGKITIENARWNKPAIITLPLEVQVAAYPPNGAVFANFGCDLEINTVHFDGSLKNSPFTGSVSFILHVNGRTHTDRTNISHADEAISAIGNGCSVNRMDLSDITGAAFSIDDGATLYVGHPTEGLNVAHMYSDPINEMQFNTGLITNGRALKISGVPDAAIATKVTKTVGAGKDFPLFADAMTWALNTPVIGRGEVELVLDDGDHVTGPAVDTDIHSEYYNISGENRISLVSASKDATKCFLALATPATTHHPYMFVLEDGILHITDITLAPGKAGYADVGRAVLLYSEVGGEAKFNDVSVDGGDGVVDLRGDAFVELKGYKNPTIKDVDSRIFQAQEGSRISIGVDYAFENCPGEKIKVQNGGQVKLLATFTYDTASQRTVNAAAHSVGQFNPPLNQMDPATSLITDRNDLTIHGSVIPPAADPHIVGALWNNAGTLAISAG